MQVTAWLATALDPSLLMEAAGLAPDPWQRDLLRSESDRILLLACRQAGKSTTTACLALHTALFRPESLVLLVSPSLRQSGEIFRKLLGLYGAVGRPVPPVAENATSLHLANGSRVVSLPGAQDTVRGYSAPALVVVDEAAQVADGLFAAVAPMLAVSRGRLALLSTPFGQRGVFHDQWSDPSARWERVRVTAHDCPRIDPDWLAGQRQVLGERWYAQEFLCEFVEMAGQAFGTDAVLSAFSSEEAPLFGADAS